MTDTGRAAWKPNTARLVTQHNHPTRGWGEIPEWAMHVHRAKGGEAATHPILGDELRALWELKRQSASPFVFASERGGPFTPSGFARLLARAGDEANFGFKVHPHMLRHACGYALANKGIDTRTLPAYPFLLWRGNAFRIPDDVLLLPRLPALCSRMSYRYCEIS